jgi:hypothetical protein
MKIKNRKSIMIEDMNCFDYLANDDSYVEVTKYSNGEDVYDVKTDDSNFTISKGQIEAILCCIYQLNLSKGE